MRIVTSAFAALLFVAAGPVSADDIELTRPVPGLIVGQPADVDFHQASRAFGLQMQAMVGELADPANRRDAGAIVARYQLEADRFADMVQIRKVAGERLTGPYANAMTVRALPGNLRREINERQRFVTFSPRRSVEMTTGQYGSTGLVSTPRDRAF